MSKHPKTQTGDLGRLVKGGLGVPLLKITGRVKELYKLVGIIYLNICICMCIYVCVYAYIHVYTCVYISDKCTTIATACTLAHTRVIVPLLSNAPSLIAYTIF